jgi:hypothetical protein
VADGELIFANVVDAADRAAVGDMADSVVHMVAPGTRALPFVILRHWKAPTGYVSEEIELIAPSGDVAHRVGPMASWMYGQMDVTRLETRVEDATLEEPGGYLASFILEGDLVAQVDFVVDLRPPPAKLAQSYEDGFKRSDVIWLGHEVRGREHTVPVWFAYRNGRAYVLSQLEPGPDEQTVPGIPGTEELIVVSRRKGRDTSLERFRAVSRVLEGEEWEQAAILLADRRRSRHGSPQESIERWRGACAIAELTPLVSS